MNHSLLVAGMTKNSPARLTYLLYYTVLLVSVCGCGQGGAYGVVPAEGSVKYDDGTLIEAGRIELLFVSQEEAIDAKTHPRQGVAEVNVADGTFTASTYGFHDGVIRGEHRVIAQSIAPQGGYTKAIPKKYSRAESTPLVIDAQGQSIDLVIEKP